MSLDTLTNLARHIQRRMHTVLRRSGFGCIRTYACQRSNPPRPQTGKVNFPKEADVSILLDSNMRIKITDFGTAKILDIPNRGAGDSPVALPQDSGAESESRANSFVGTAEYVSPELLTDKSAYKSSDLWAFGCIVYQLLAGRPPFKAANEYQTFQKIVNLEYDFPHSFPDQARDLVEKLLVLDPTQRLTIREIKRHPFFEGQEWGRALWKQKPPRLRPLKAGVVASFGSTPAPVHGEREASQRLVNGTGEVIIASVPDARPAENGNRMSAASSVNAYPPFQRDYRSSSEIASPNRQSAPPPVVAQQPQNRHSYHSLPRHSIPRPRSQPRLSIFQQQNNMSEADIKWAKTLNLNGNERIVKIGRTIVHSQTQNGKTSTPGKFARKLLGRKKERTLILTNEGRAFLVSENHDDLPDIGDTGKIKGTIPLDKFSITTLEDEPKGRMLSVETVSLSPLTDIRDKQSFYWKIRSDRLVSGWKHLYGFQTIYLSLRGCIFRISDIHKVWTSKRRNRFKRGKLKREM
jgi:serine/threonine protein kinase